jgi:hypothetical protein
MSNDQQPFVGAVAGVAAKVIIPAVLREVFERTLGAQEAAKVEQAIKKNPEAVNQINAEPLAKSRVVVGSSGALLPAIGYLLWAFSSYGFELGKYDPSSTFLAVMTVIGSGTAFYGRVKGRLKPIGAK